MTKSSITGININWPHDSVHGYLQQVMKEFHYLYSVCQHPPQETGVLKYMSEVFICRGGSGGGGSGGIWNGYAKILEYKVFNKPGSNGFNMPFNIVNNKVDIFVYGAGGGGWMYTTYSSGNKYGGGGGGWMNRIYNVSLVPGKTYNVYVGLSGYSKEDELGTNSILTNYTVAGSSSYFDTYVSANGGSAGRANGIGGSGGSGGAGTYGGGRGYQFGGGAAIWEGNGSYAYDYTTNGLLKGGDGGVWGGGGGGMFSNGGNGGYYGGGGGTSRLKNDWLSSSSISTGGNGGYYGGGGGSINNIALGGYYNDNGTWKQSGFGGNGGNLTVEGENGTNTIGYTNFKEHTNEGFNEVNYNLAGNGISIKCSDANNKGWSSGGGGYGGTGGNRASSPIAWHQTGSGCGGGGGYGSSGGDGMDTRYYDYYPGGGGGGGYGGNGSSYGGGGGYMSDGYGGGGGYWSDGQYRGGGGGKLSIPVNNTYETYQFGNGASPQGTVQVPAGEGIVVLRYYKWVDPRNPT